MTETAGPLRAAVFSCVTKSLLLFGRLHPDYNVKYLPMTLKSILEVLLELEQLEKKNSDFVNVLRESIEQREKNSMAFPIPSALLINPTIKGFQQAIDDLVNPLLKSYCSETKKFIENKLNSQVTKEIKHELLYTAKENCKLLSNFSSEENTAAVQSFREWCELGLSKF